GHLVRLMDFHTAVRPTAMVETHRPPTYPAVRAPGLQKRRGLAALTLTTSTTGAGVTLSHTRVALLVTQERQHRLKTGFAIDRSYFNAIHPTPLPDFFTGP